MPYSIDQLNQMSQEQFITVLGSVFEHTPSIAEKAGLERPFANVGELHQAMVKGVHEMSDDERLALICAHPDLGTKTKMAEDSVEEQSGIGLDQLAPDEFDQFQSLNQVYRDRFGFPFIIAVREHTKESLLEAFETRLERSLEEEKEQALNQICQIAQFRLEKIIQ